MRWVQVFITEIVEDLYIPFILTVARIQVSSSMVKVLPIRFDSMSKCKEDIPDGALRVETSPGVASLDKAGDLLLELSEGRSIQAVLVGILHLVYRLATPEEPVWNIGNEDCNIP